jgi:hypothetical protein
MATDTSVNTKSQFGSTAAGTNYGYAIYTNGKFSCYNYSYLKKPHWLQINSIPSQVLRLGSISIIQKGSDDGV